MFPRTLASLVMTSLQKNKAVALVGPRQSGKTTLARICAPDYHYFSLENPDHRARALEDPRLFLKSCSGSTILDEVQYVPELFSWLQEILDDKKDKRRFILTGSNSFQLNEKISQSLAGRIRLLRVLPLTLEELPDTEVQQDIDQLIIKGMYPRIYDEDLEPSQWFSDYYQTYIQKDIKMIVNVSDTNQFDRFVRLCAGRVAQLGEYNSIANEAGISQPTAIRWASVLESSFITFRLSPHFKSFNKKIIKSPKLYFYDTGLLCQLLRIKNADMLMIHPMRGEIFENFIVAEILKTFQSYGQEAPVYFWRDQHGHEIDLILDMATHFHCLEIKSGATYKKDWLKNLLWFLKLAPQSRLALFYGGADRFISDDIPVHSWKNITGFVKSVM